MSEAAIPETRPLIGTEEATIDDKGRLLVSKKKRDRLGEPFVMALGDAGCAVAFPEAVWMRLYREVMKAPSTNQGRQQYSRLVLATATDDLGFDKQGRVVVPQKLREDARLKDKVMVVGCGDRIEIWAKEEWSKYDKDPEGYGRERREAIQRAEREMTGKE